MASNQTPMAYKALTCDRHWVLEVQNQTMSYCGLGICDPVLQSSVSALVPFRRSSGLFAWASTTPVAGGGAINTDGNDLLLASNQVLNLFTTGVGELIPGGWWNNTIVETELFRSGAPTDRGMMFLCSGMAATVHDPFQAAGAGGTVSTDPKMYSAWLGQNEDGPGYSFLIQKYLLLNTAVTIAFADQGTQYRAGTLAQYPSAGGPAGSQTVRNGLVCAPGMYLPFMAAIAFGSRDDVKQVTVTLTTGQAARIQSSNPGTVSGSAVGTNHTINTANIGTVFSEIEVAMYGRIICVPDEAFCGIPSLTPEELMAVKATFAARGLPASQTQPAYPGAGPMSYNPNVPG